MRKGTIIQDNNAKEGNGKTNMHVECTVPKEVEAKEIIMITVPQASVKSKIPALVHNRS